MTLFRACLTSWLFLLASYFFHFFLGFWSSKIRKSFSFYFLIFCLFLEAKDLTTRSSKNSFSLHIHIILRVLLVAVISMIVIMFFFWMFNIIFFIVLLWYDVVCLTKKVTIFRMNCIYLFLP